jgi:hypothetical protein
LVEAVPVQKKTVFRLLSGIHSLREFQKGSIGPSCDWAVKILSAY